MIIRRSQWMTTALVFCLLAIKFPVFAADLYMFRNEEGQRYYTNMPVPGCTKVRLPHILKQNKSSAPSVSTEGKENNYELLIVQAGKAHSVDPDIVRAVIKAESNFNPRAVSPKGAQGLMQLMPQTARELGVVDPFDPAANIYGGVKYLGRLLDVLEGDLPLSLAAYNAGLERVIYKKTIPSIRETRNYVKQVMNYYSELKGY